MDLLELLERQYSKTADWVANVRPDQLGNPTPCSEWDTRTLLNHIIGGNYMFATVVGGETMDMSQEPPDFAGQDAIGHFQQSSKAAVEAFRTPGAMERVVDVPVGSYPGAAVLGFALTDAAVHGWDVAKATNQDPSLDDDIAATLHAVLQEALDEKFRQDPYNSFKEPVPIGADASPTDKLVAFLGRRP